MSDISDPGRVGRGDRRRAQKQIDAAYAAGKLTAADRALRTQRVESAHTKGDLAVLLRDLNRLDGTAAAAGVAAGAAEPTTAPSASTPPPTTSTSSLGSAIPPDQLAAMSAGDAARVIRVGESMRTALTGDNVRKVRRIFLIVLVGFIVLCGLGLFGIVGAIVKEVDHAVSTDGSSGGETGVASTPSVSLQTARGWSEPVAAIDKETGTSRVYDAVVYPEYATVNAVAGEGAMRYVYRNGSFQMFNSPVTPAQGKPIDLADIDPKLVERLPERTAKRQGMPDFDSAYLIVNRLTGRPAILVYVQQSGRLSRWSIYDLDGKVIGGTPD